MVILTEPVVPEFMVYSFLFLRIASYNLSVIMQMAVYYQ